MNTYRMPYPIEGPANTGLEHQATLEFVRDVEHEWGVPIVWLEYRYTAPERLFDQTEEDSIPCMCTD